MAENTTINDLLNKNIQTNVYSYSYSDPVKITAKDMVTSLSKENWRFSHLENRYQVFKDDAVYSDELDFYDLQQSLNQIHDNDIPAMPLNYRRPDITIDLIHAANQLGLSIYGVKQKLYSRNEVLNDNLMIAALKRRKKTDYFQIVTVKDDDGSNISVDLEYNKVFKEIDTKNNNEYISYLIRDKEGNLLLEDIPEKSLNVVLYALMSEITPENIKKILLSPQISQDELANSSLIYDLYYYSLPKEILSIDDLTSDYDTSMPEDKKYTVSKCSFWNNNHTQILTNRFDLEDIIPTINYLYHDIDQDNKQLEIGKYILNGYLVKITNAKDMRIIRYSRQKDLRGHITKFDLTDGKITSLDENNVEHDQDLDGITRVETVFAIIDSKGQVIQNDLTFEDLFTYAIGIDKES